MNLPPIPTEALIAVAAQYPPHMKAPAERALADAWPHLYVTALRHAAEQMDVPEMTWPGDALRALANEATT